MVLGLTAGLILCIGAACCCVSLRICDPEPIQKYRNSATVPSTVLDANNKVVFTSLEEEDHEFS